MNKKHNYIDEILFPNQSVKIITTFVSVLKFLSYINFRSVSF